MSSVLRRTSNHSKFVPFRQNRIVRLKKETVKELINSMKKYGYIPAFPLLVVHNGSSGLLIKAGHHRFEAAKQLGIPVYYVICDNEITIAEIERTTTPWTPGSFIESYGRSGMSEYVKLESFSERSGISPNMSAILLSGANHRGTGKFTKELKEGKFEVKDPGFADSVADIVSHCESQGIKFAASSTFVSALAKAVRVKGFDIKVFKFKVKSHTALMKKQVSLVGYLELIQKIYNRQSSNLLPLLIEVEKMERANKSH
jgi:hypothetical protein